MVYNELNAVYNKKMPSFLVDSGDYASSLISQAERGDNARAEVALAARDLLRENVDADEREFNLQVVDELLDWLCFQK